MDTGHDRRTLRSLRSIRRMSCSPIRSCRSSLRLSSAYSSNLDRNRDRLRKKCFRSNLIQIPLTETPQHTSRTTSRPRRSVLHQTDLPTVTRRWSNKPAYTDWGSEKYVICSPPTSLTVHRNCHATGALGGSEMSFRFSIGLDTTHHKNDGRPECQSTGENQHRGTR